MNSNDKQAERVRYARAAAHRSDDGEAFLPDPSNTGSHIALGGTDVESFAEEFIASATAGEPVEMDAQDEVVEEEWGGPFLELDAETGEPNDVTDPMGEPAPDSLERPTVDKLPPRGD
jgi:hypothetical protein